MLMAIAASKLQYQGSMTGTWFDLDNPDAVPLFENEAFYQAAELTRRLWMHSIDDQPGGWVELHEDYWHNGRCASYMWLTGSVALVLTKNRIRRCASYPVPCGENDEVLWEPTREDGSYWEPRRFRSMGSAQVYDRTDGKMKTCTPEASPKGNEVMCPYLDAEEDERDGVWINRAPVSSKPCLPRSSMGLFFDVLTPPFCSTSTLHTNTLRFPSATGQIRPPRTYSGTLSSWQTSRLPLSSLRIWVQPILTLSAVHI